LKNIIATCWGIFFIVWVLAALFTKRTVYREDRLRRLRYLLPILIGWFLFFRANRFSAPLSLRMFPQTDALLAVAAILCICGLAICLWARAVLGRNWSGTVTLKENHELIVRGPYRFVRHPIYTGILLMLIGTWLELGHLAGIIGVLLVIVSLSIKLLDEEAVMLKQFPDQYPDYQKRVKRIIPFLL
jgi:protein-S-isoprenylcysteine O-methyltransferase